MIEALKRAWRSIRKNPDDDIEELARLSAKLRRKHKEDYGVDMPDFKSEIGADVKAIEAALGIKKRERR